MDIVVNTPGQGVKAEVVEAPKEAKNTTFSLPEGELSEIFNGDGSSLKTDTISDIKVDKGGIIEDKSKEAKEAKEAVTKLTDTIKQVDKAAPVEAGKKTDEVKKEEVKKEEVKVETVKIEPTAKVKAEIKPISPIKDSSKADNDTFDYAKYSPVEQTNMKNMSRQSRQAYAEILEENKKLSSLKDANYLQHEQAYTLSPDYQNLQNRHQLAAIEGQCWQNSLLQAKKNGKYQEIINWDKNGNPVFSALKDITDADEIRLQQNMTLCNQEANKLSNDLNQYPNQYKNRISVDMGAIEQERKQRFAWVGDGKLLEAPIDMEDGSQHTVKQIRDNFIGLFPSYLHTNVGVQVAADLMVALQISHRDLREASNGRKVAEIKKEEIQRAEPTSDQVYKESSDREKKGIPSVFNGEGFPQR